MRTFISFLFGVSPRRIDRRAESEQIDRVFIRHYHVSLASLWTSRVLIERIFPNAGIQAIQATDVNYRDVSRLRGDFGGEPSGSWIFPQT